ncbi:MAG: hypothetical protein PHD48_10520 [Alphaproteobacteria bacterium]|nr:hypothetical protein [Alphaproteobacteria bacterium]
MLQYLVFIGFAINLYGVFDYVKDTLRGETKPNRMTFALWALAPSIASVAAIADGVTWAVVPVFACAVSDFLILFVSFVNKKAYWKLERLDWICGALSLIGLVLWQVTKNPNIAILFAVFSDFAAAFPTLVKSWYHPETETPSFYVAAGLGAATSFFALENYSFAEIAFPLYLVIIDIVIVGFIYGGRYRLKRQKLAA